MFFRLALSALLCLSSLGAAGATPARIIILRHGEKADAWNLCETGQDRANALATYYLGRDAGSTSKKVSPAWWRRWVAYGL